MVNKLKLIWTILSFFAASALHAQADTTFWFAAPEVTSDNGNIPTVLHLSSYASSATVTVSEPANPSFQTQTVTLNAYSATTVTLTSQLNYVENKPANTILPYGIKISSTAKISAYYEEASAKNPEIFPLKGVLATGLKFMIPSQTTLANSSFFTVAKSGFIVVATEDNTTVSLNLNVADSAGKTTYTVTLNKGQTYAVRASDKTVAAHFGGSTVTANKPVSVTIYDDSLDAVSICSSCNCKDLIGDQILPIANNGSEFIIVRGDLDILSNEDYYYVWATSDNTSITVNGSLVATINTGQSYTGTLSDPSAYIVTSNPVYLYQMTGVSCEVGATNLPSIKCTGSQLVSFSRATTETFQLNLLCKAADIGNFSVNGTTGIITASMFAAVPGTNNAWMAARITSSNLPSINTLFVAGSTSVVSNSSGLFHLGFMNGEVSTGARFGYFSNYSTVLSNPIVASTTCVGSDIQLNSTLVSGATYSWTGPNNFTSNVYNPVISKAALSNTGVYYLTATINGCGTSVDSVTVNVHPLPTVSFTKSLDTLCYGSSKNLSFSLSGTAPWTFIYNNQVQNDTLTNITASPLYINVSPLSKTIYTAISITDSNSCMMSNISVAANYDTLMVDSLPIARIKYSTPSCLGNTVNFTDSSTTYLDSLASWYWIFGNGKTLQTTKDSTIGQIFTNWGNDTVKLAVQSALGCKSDTAVQVITIHPLPVPGFALPELCLTDAHAQFTDTSTIVDQTTSFTYHWNFGDSLASVTYPDTSIVKNPLHHYSAQGHYRVKEIVTSVYGCTDSTTEILTVNGAVPNAKFALNNLSTKCSNDSVKITNLSAVDFGSVTWLKIYWDYVNNPTLFDSIPTPDSGAVYAHLYPNFTAVTQNFTLHFLAYSGLSCVNIKDTVITLTASPVVQFTTIPGICADATGRQITQASEANPNLSGNFYYSGTGISNTGYFTTNKAGVGTDTLQALFISTTGCRDSASQTITVWPSPVARWGFGTPDCALNSIVFTDSSLANYSHITQWSWNFGDGSNAEYSNGNAFSKTYSAAGTDTASLFVTTDSGCISKPDTLVIVIHPLPAVNFGMPAAVCLPSGLAQFTDSTTITDGSEALFTYDWKFGDSNNLAGSLIENPVHQYSATGQYAVTLTVTSKNGCIDSLTKTFSAIYPQPKSAFTYSSNRVCMGDTIYFYDASYAYNGSIQSWHWYLAEGDSSSLQNPYRQFADSGYYAVTLFIFDTKGCVSDTSVHQFTINPYPHLSMASQVNVLQGGSYRFTPQYYADSASFLWTPATYLDSTTVANPVTSPLTNITYQLQLTGASNCAVTDTVHVTVLLTPVIPNVFSPNGDGINDTWVIEYLNSYPDCTVQVFDRDGQAIYYSEGYSIPWDGTYKGKPLPIGTYYYVINPKNGRSVMSGSVTILR